MKKFEKVFKEKERYRKELLNLNFDEKLQILSQLQERAVIFGHTDVRFKFDDDFKFENIIDIIDDLKSNNLIEDYVLGGSVALLYYTNPDFLTTDVDIFVTPNNNSPIFNLSPIYDYLKNNYNAIEKKEWIEVSTIPLQFLAPDKDLHGDAFKDAQEVEVNGKKFKILTLEYLIAIMLLVNNKKYKARLIQVIEENNFDINKLEPILKKYNIKYNLLDKWNRINKILND